MLLNITTELSGILNVRWSDLLEMEDKRMDKIRIDEIIILGKKMKGCPFSLSMMSPCYISKVNCRYGLAEVRLPKKCPLRSHSVKVEFTSKVVETDF